ncbi:unnamed protein product, partial [Prorocentrum cordatum]
AAAPRGSGSRWRRPGGQLRRRPADRWRRSPRAGMACPCPGWPDGHGRGSGAADGPAPAPEGLSAAAAEQNTDMVDIPAGRFPMGIEKERVHFRQDGEGPLRQVRMSGFRLDRFEVSNRKFQEFVEETGHVTEAELFGDSFVAELYLSEAVSRTVDVKVAAVPWWLPVKNATWRTPEGLDSGLDGERSRFGDRWNHPVVHISWNDATAYCRWRNASLPSEAQWEYAAHGSSSSPNLYPWGNLTYGDPKKHRMNIWQGTFPTSNTAKDKWIKTAPVDAYGPQNDWGLYNMVGNVWEWVGDWFTPVHFLTEETQATGFVDPLGPSVDELDQVVEMGYMSRDGSGQFEKVKKGGSFMCHKSYCWRYRICARSHLSAESTAHHVGVRCARPAEDAEAAHWSRAPERRQPPRTPQ